MTSRSVAEIPLVAHRTTEMDLPSLISTGVRVEAIAAFSGAIAGFSS